MRKIKSYFFISLDGVVESPDEWHFPYFDDEMGAAVGGGGRARLFPADEPTHPLTLLSSQALKSGVLNLSYGPAAAQS